MLCWLSNNYLCCSITNSYGASDGYPSQHGITKDAQVCVAVDFLILYDILPAFVFHQISMSMHPFLFEQAALDHLFQRTDIDKSGIVVFGRSLGGAVGAVLTKNNPDKVQL